MADTTPFTLTGRAAVVTGGANGIGAGIAEVLAESGATVVVADRDRAGHRRPMALGHQKAPVLPHAW